MSTVGSEYLAMLNGICKRIQEADVLEEILWELEQDVLSFLHAQRLTIYRRDASNDRLQSWYKSDSDVDEIRVNIDATSIAGYVALSGQPLRIDNVYDAEELQAIHPDLFFDDSYDQLSGNLTSSMICVPIKFRDTTLGVFQVMNRMDHSSFTDENVIHTLAIANLMGQKMRMTMTSAISPYQYLVELGRVTMDELFDIESSTKGESYKITRWLMKDKNVKIEEIASALESYFRVPFMGYDETFEPDFDLLQNLDRAYLARHYWVPFTGVNGETIILMDDPSNADRIFEIEQLCNAQNLDLRVGLRIDILRYLGYQLGDAEEKAADLGDLVSRLEAEGAMMTEAAAADDGDVDENAGVIVQLVNRLILDAVKLKASDIHIEPSKGTVNATVRVRVDGACRDILEVPSTHIRAVVARIKVLSRLDIAERRKPQDGKMALRLGGHPLELRVATVPTVNGESAVMRILASGNAALPMDKLNLLPRVFDGINKMLARPHGIFLVVGPTGSGKTTTLHGLLGSINTRERKILTAEDPVEITQHGLQQVQVMARIGLTFAAALRSFLRADPDVILIGEMRDFETAHIGMEASLTGHLVFSTLHTNSAPETVIRLLEMGLDPLNFADALIGVCAQRLVRTLCKNCKQPYSPSQAELEELVDAFGHEYVGELVMNTSSGELQLYRPVGCDECMRTGYKGRTGIHELLTGTVEMKKIIARKHATGHEIRHLAMQEGMRTLRQDGISKIFMGHTDWNQLRKITTD